MPAERVAIGAGLAVAVAPIRARGIEYENYDLHMRSLRLELEDVEVVCMTKYLLFVRTACIAGANSYLSQKRRLRTENK